MKRYLFSDFDPETRFTGIAGVLSEDLTQRRLLAFIASNPDLGEGTDRYAQKYIQWLVEIGLGFDEYVVLDNRMSALETQQTLERASVLYLMGGRTQLQMEFLRAKDLTNVIQRFEGVVMGLSAGAINMGKIAICTRVSGHDQQVIYQGLGLTEFIVKPHFDPKAIPSELFDLSWHYPIHGLCENSAVCIRGEKTTYLGDVFLLQNGLVTQIS